MDELQAWLGGSVPCAFSPTPPTEAFKEEIARGKMFGVLVVEEMNENNGLGGSRMDADAVSINVETGLAPSSPQMATNNMSVSRLDGASPVSTIMRFARPFGTPCNPQSIRSRKLSTPHTLYYLAGYSGQICGRADWPDFVPAVFDYLQDDGYFKREEAEIVGINRQISLLKKTHTESQKASQKTDDTEVDPRPTIYKGKKEGETDEEYIRRRQHENAELHRWKLRERNRQEAAAAVIRKEQEEIKSLKTLRRKRSDALQTWLFRQFIMRNGEHQEKDLVDIFRDFNTTSSTEATATALPPAGSGECCEPRLLQWALEHGLRPVSMAMFWWGESPRGEVRHHLQCYPACQGKCKPILGWMLQGISVEPNPLEQQTRHEVEIVYEDQDICVVSKPSGMLSVPGKSCRESVWSVMKERWPEAEGPLIVHRLDMDTSGLMVLAKTWDAYRALQRQFLNHEVKKRYIARLTHDIAEASGDISLPLRPDLHDRPRQVVDPVHGKPAETHWERIDRRTVALYPHTGRTHQLRVHCAHRDGLNNPILGDPLYGRAPLPGEEAPTRLCLHAESITFRHPTTGKEMRFAAPIK